MDDATLKFGLTAFATLLVVVDPFGVLPIFISLARNRPARERSRLATRAVVLGFMISLFFLVAGHSALAFLGVSVHAFSISGGILLFVTALPMLFGQTAGVAVGGEKRERAGGYCDFSARDPAPCRSRDDYEHSAADRSRHVGALQCLRWLARRDARAWYLARGACRPVCAQWHQRVPATA